MERHPYKVDKTVFKTKAEKCALKIIEWLMKNELWDDICIYVGGKRYGTFGEDGHYHYNDGNIYCEDDMNPLDYFDFAGDFLSMSFEGNFYDIVNNSFGSLSSTRMKEFRAIIDKYGKHYELGDMWNLSLYDND